MASTLDDIAILSLVGLNSEAHDVIAYSPNAPYVSSFYDPDGDTNVTGLEVGPHLIQSSLTLVTMGRRVSRAEGHSEGHITISDSDVTSRVHCRIEWEPAGNQVVLVQESQQGLTRYLQNLGGDLFRDIPFTTRDGNRPQVVLRPDLRSTVLSLQLGNEVAEFKIIWHFRNFQAAKRVLQHRTRDPERDRTRPLDGVSCEELGISTRMHLPGSKSCIRYGSRVPLESKRNWEVYKVKLDLSREKMVVKRVRKPSIETAEYASLKLELEVLQILKHENIVQFYGAQWASGYLELFTYKMKGNVQALARKVTFPGNDYLSNSLMYQALKAAKCLEEHGLIHRDIKPSNFLYKFVGPAEFDYHFQLADFGSVARVGRATLQIGTDRFMSPEIASGPLNGQSTKSDIERVSNNPDRMKLIVQDAAQFATSVEVTRMSRDIPSERPSAGDLLVALYSDGEIRPLFQSERPPPPYSEAEEV